MRTALVLALLAVPFMSNGAMGHGREVEGTVELIRLDEFNCPLCRILVPDLWAEIRGLQYELIEGVREGEAFLLESKEPRRLLMVGTDDQCPEENNGGDPWGANARPTDPEWWTNDLNLLCNYVPDFDITFTGGDHRNGPGDEEGTVPAAGDAIVTLFMGSLDTLPGPEDFVYHDGF